MTRIVAFWPFLEFVTAAGGESEMASRTADRSPPPTRAGGQDDGSYTNSLKLQRVWGRLDKRLFTSHAGVPTVHVFA